MTGARDAPAPAPTPTPAPEIGGRGTRWRYLAVIVLGFGVDYALALALVRFAGVALVPAATAGFAAGLALNYVLFELWAFAAPHRPASGQRFSGRRFAGTLASAGIALGVRLAVVAVAAALALRLAASPTTLAPGIFLLGAAASALVNYRLVSRLFGGLPAAAGRAP